MPGEWESAVWMDVTGSATDVPNPIKVSPMTSGDTPPLVVTSTEPPTRNSSTPGSQSLLRGMGWS